MPHPIDAHIGRKICEARVSLGMSQRQLGSAIGISHQQLQKHEKGFSRVTATRLWKLACVFNLPMDYFFEGIECQSRVSPTGNGKETLLQSISLAGQIEAITDHRIRQQIADLIKVCTRY